MKTDTKQVKPMVWQTIQIRKNVTYRKFDGKKNCKQYNSTTSTTVAMRNWLTLWPGLEQNHLKCFMVENDQQMNLKFIPKTKCSSWKRTSKPQTRSKFFKVKKADTNFNIQSSSSWQKRSKPHHRDPCSNIVPQRKEVNDLSKRKVFSCPGRLD